MNVSSTIEEIEYKYPTFQLGKIATTSSGGTPLSSVKEYYEGGKIPWINSGEVREGVIISANNYITEEGLKNSSAKIFPINTVLIAMYGATAGQVGILGIEAATNQAICGILPSEKLLPLYTYNYFKMQLENLLNLRSGVARLNISQKIIQDYKIPVPSIAIQERIIGEIEAIEKKEIEVRKKIEDKQKSIRDGVNDLFTKNSVSLNIGHLFRINSESTNPELAYGSDEFIYVDIDSVGKGDGTILFNQRIIGENAPSRAKRIAKDNTVIVSTVRPYLKGFAYLEKEVENTVYSTGFALINSKDENKYFAKLLYYYFMYSDNLMSQMEAKMPKASYPSINKSDIKSFLIPDISIIEQKKVLTEFEVLQNEISNLEKSIANVEEEKREVLIKYLEE